MPRRSLMEMSAIEFSFEDEFLYLTRAVQHSENENRAITNDKKRAVGEIPQSHTADIFKPDGMQERVLRGGMHGVARLVHESNGHIGVALIIPKGGFLHVRVNERMF